MRRLTPDLDRSVAVLIVKVGRYPLHYGGVGAIRTLGRLGVPVYAITEGRLTPATVSRYLRRPFVWPTTGQEDPEELVEGLLAIGRRLEGRVIALPTDDEAAVLLGEHADALAERFEFARLPPTLARDLADKFTLHQLCKTYGVPTPTSARPSSVEDLLTVAEQIGYPVVLKNAEPWARLRVPAVAHTTVVTGEAELRSLADAWTTMPKVLVQEYLRGGDGAQDWIAHVCCDTEPADQVTFTGVKVRSWPAHAGVTTRGYSAANEVLADMTRRLCRDIGYRGIGDLDWRLDPVDGRYKLLDFNPRVGGQFRLFETASGVDVVRALHLNLTGRPVPPGKQVERRRWRVETLDIPALAVDWRESGHRPRRLAKGETERAWWALDDPLPAAAAAVLSASPALSLLARTLQPRAAGSTPHVGSSSAGPPTSAPRTGDVSVVICAYTTDRWIDLQKSVTSVRAQSSPVHEIIVVIDHNPELLEWAQACWKIPGQDEQGDRPVVRVAASTGRPGLSGARNTGVAIAGAPIVAFLDDDATAHPTWVERMVEPYADPRVLVCGGAALPLLTSPRPNWWPVEFDWVIGCSYPGLPPGRARVRNPIGANMSLRRTALDLVGGFQEGIGRVGRKPVGCEETDLCIRLVQRRPDAVILYEPSARVSHTVPAERLSWSYFSTRCVAEGRSKALVAARVGREAALESERSYALSVLPLGMARGLVGACRGEPASALRALAMAAGLAMTTAGYLHGRLASMRRPWRHERPRATVPSPSQAIRRRRATGNFSR